MTHPLEKNAKRALVAEDDEVLVEAMATALRRGGFVVDIARNGQDTVESLRRSAPDVLLLDLLMPVMDGFDVLAELEAMRAAGAGSPPVVVVSNLSSDDDKRRGEALGVVEYLVKSDVSLNGIVDAANRAVQGEPK